MDSKAFHDVVIAQIRQTALQCQRRIVITDGEDERAIEAVVRLCEELAPPSTATPPHSPSQSSKLQFVLVGNPEKIAGHRLLQQTLPARTSVRNPTADPAIPRFAELYRELMAQRGKTVTAAEARARVQHIEYFSALLVRAGEADGMLGGSSIPTAKVLRAGIEVIGMNAHSKVVSGSFFMFLPRPLPGGQQALVMADCAVVPNPDAEQLADIAINTVVSAQSVMEINPVVAFVSFSTKGSAKYDGLEKLKRALLLVQHRAPNLRADGELQIDAALVPEIGERKDPNGFVRGQANVLIFPDLNSGNIAYKLVERVGGAKALGVILSGFAKPVNDLSRGCSVEDIMDMICITAVQSEREAGTAMSGAVELAAASDLRSSPERRGRMEA